MANRAGFANNLIVPTVLAIGFVLRLIGVNVGLPDSPDPREVLIAQDVLNLIDFTAPPQIYNWPGTAWFYIIAGVGKLLSFCGWYPTETRVILLGTLHQCPIVYSNALVHLSYRVSLLQQTCRSTCSRIARRCDVTRHQRVAFRTCRHPRDFLCGTVSLGHLTRARSTATALTFPTAIWLGVIVGVGFAVKFTTIFVVFALLCFIGSEHYYRKLATIVSVSALTFTFLGPYWLIDLISPEWNLFFADFCYEASHYHWGHFGLISTAESDGLGRFIYLWTLLKWGMGLPLALLVCFGVLWALVPLKSSQQSARGWKNGRTEGWGIPTFQPSNLPTKNLPVFQPSNPSSYYLSLFLIYCLLGYTRLSLYVIC